MYKKIFGIGLLGCLVYVAYSYHKLGWHTRPVMPDGAFSISFKSGFRAILVGIPNERSTRRYLGFPMEVPFYITDAWSFCESPSEQEIVEITAQRGEFPGERIEAICRVEVDEDSVVRGFITTVPKL